jgi:hypothetical protein
MATVNLFLTTIINKGLHFCNNLFNIAMINISVEVFIIINSYLDKIP